MNPLLKLPAAEMLKTLPPEAKEALCAVLKDLRAQANELAEKSWKKRKGPMAAYWRAVSTYAGHIARAARSHQPPDLESDPSVLFEMGRQEADREWRRKMYERGGQELVELLCKHWNKPHLINLIESAK